MSDLPPNTGQPAQPEGEPPAAEPPAAWPPAPQPYQDPSAYSAAPPPGSMPPSPPESAPEPPAAWGTPPPRAGGPPEVPGAAGHLFAATVTRVAALLVDSIVVGIAAAVIGGVIGGAAGASSAGSLSSGSAAGAAVTVTAGLAGLLVSYLYFGLLWRSAGKATLGQRVFRMQVGNAFDGATLTWRQVTIRWLSLFGLGILAALPTVGGIGGLLAFIWSIVLLVTTATSPTKQGLHDRWANSAVVATGPQNTALAWGCLILYVIGFVLVAFLALALLVAIFAVATGVS